MISFTETITRKLEFEKWAKIPNRGQLTSLTTKTFTTLAVWT